MNNTECKTDVYLQPEIEVFNAETEVNFCVSGVGGTGTNEGSNPWDE